MRKTASVLLLLACVAAAQMPAPSSVELDAMKKFGFLAGKWEGDGWIMMGPQGRTDFKGSETVQWKLQGRVLLVEGLFKAPVAGNPEPVTVHETLAVISYDEKAGKYNFRTYLARGGSGDHEIKLREGGNGFEWSLDTGRGTARYIMWLDESRAWVETGEHSSDGQTWRKFFEMKLKKVS
jgi:hypothetical protein